MPSHAGRNSAAALVAGFDLFVSCAANPAVRGEAIGELRVPDNAFALSAQWPQPQSLNCCKMDVVVLGILLLSPSGLAGC